MEKRIVIVACCLFFYTNFFSQLTANFLANTTTICVGQSVSFTNLSSSDAIFWDWTFQTAPGSFQSFSGAFPPSITYNTPGSYFVSLVVTDLGGLQDDETKLNYIRVVGSPIITLTSAPNSNNQIICEGNSLQPTITYTVNSANSAAVSNLPNGVGYTVSTTPTGCLVTITGTPTVSGLYTYTVQSLQNYCGSTPIFSNGTIKVNPLPIVDAGNNQSVCEGSTVTLAATGATSYSWDNGVIDGVAFAPTTSGTFTVTGTSAANCENTDQVIVTVNNLPIVNAGPNQTICLGTAITLTATGANTYLWDNSVVNGIPFTPASTNIYTVIGTNTTTGCANTDDVSVIVDILPQASAGGSQTICVNGSATVFGASASGGNISWSHNGNGILSNATSLTPTYNSVNSDAGNTVTLTLTVNNVNSCGNPNAFASFTVVVVANPTLTLTSASATTNQLICNNTALANIQYIFGGAGTTVLASGLPAGIVPNISGNSLTISGMPAETGAFNYMVSTLGACPSIMLMGTIEIQGSTLELLSAPYTNNQLICLGNPIEPIVYEIGSPAIVNDLPAGLIGTFSPGIPNSYTISGIPQNIGSFYYTININGQCGNEFLIGNLYVQSIISGNTSGNDTIVCDGSAFELIGGTINTNGNMVYSYLWEYSSNVNGPFTAAPGINTSANYTSTMNANDPFNYFRRIVFAGACSDTAAVVVVSADPIPEIISIGSATICVNQTALIEPIVVSNGTIGSWTTTGFGDLVNTSTAIPSYIADSLDAGTIVNINFLVQSNNVCAPAQISGTFPVTVLDLPTLSLLSNQSTMSQTGCVNAPLDAIEIAVGGGATNAILTGSIPAGVITNFDGAIFTISGIPSQTGLFNFTVSTQGSTCSEAVISGSIEIVSPFINLVSSPFTNNQTICANSSINTIVYASSDTIIAQGLPTGITSTFLPGSPNTFSISGTPTNTGIFFYMLSTGGLCANGSATGTITVVEPIVGNTSGNDTIVCDGSAFELIGGTINTNGNMVYNYLWEYSSNVNGPFTAAPGINTSANYTSTMNANDPFNYFRRIVFAGACSDTAAVVVVSADPIPEIISIGSATICVNQTALIQPIVVSNGTIGSWTTTGFGDLVNTSTAIPSYIADSLDAGTIVNINFLVQSNNVCAPAQISGTFPVTVLDLPTLSLLSNQSTMSQTGCVNAPLDAIEIAVGGGATNAILTGSIPAGVITNFDGAIFTISGIPSQTGLFNFTVSTQGSTCSEAVISGSIEIVSPFINLVSSPFTNNQTICANSSINTIVYASSDTIIAQGLPAGISATFTPGSPNTFSISGTSTNTGIFFYMLSTGGLCANGSATGTITVVEPIVGNTSGNDTIVCDGSAFELIGGTINTNGNMVYSYLWEYSSNVNGPFTAAPGINTSANYTSTMNANDPFNYFRRIVFAGACSDTAAVAVVSADSIPEIISIGSAFICSNDTVNVTTVSILNGSITSWISSGNGQLISTDMNNPIYIADSSDAGSIVNLTFVLTSNNVCSPDSLVGVYPITVRPNPIAFLGGSTHICAIDIDAVVTGALVQNGDFQWSDNGFGTLSNTNSLSPVYTSVIEDTGSIVSIYLEVSSGMDCIYPLIDTAIFTITVDSVGIHPEITSFAGQDVTISLGQSIELNAQGVAITNWIWSPSTGLSENGISNPLASPTQSAEYILTVYDIFGCIDIDTIEITVIPDINFNIPSLFTPNGDDLNETWDIPELILLPNTAVTIINREGQEVFSSDNYTNNWDGSFKGNPLPEATYYYWIRFANSDVTYKGAVTILRNIK